jgi:hypothetical protein
VTLAQFVEQSKPWGDAFEIMQRHRQFLARGDTIGAPDANPFVPLRIRAAIAGTPDSLTKTVRRRSADAGGDEPRRHPHDATAGTSSRLRSTQSPDQSGHRHEVCLLLAGLDQPARRAVPPVDLTTVGAHIAGVGATARR